MLMSSHVYCISCGTRTRETQRSKSQTKQSQLATHGLTKQYDGSIEKEIQYNNKLEEV